MGEMLSMDHSVQVTLSSNAGVILEYRGIKLLIDGIYHTEEPAFSNLSSEGTERLLTGESPYGHIDYLLFTHTHSDHFSAELVLDYLKAHSVRRVFLPRDLARSQAVITYMEKAGIPYTLFSGAEPNILLGSDMILRAFPTRHLGEQYWDVPHVCYLLSCGQKQLFFTADADFTFEPFSQLQSLGLQAVFVNPLFFRALCYEQAIPSELTAKTICIYHIPFPGEDPTRIRTRLERQLLRWSPDKPEAIPLCSPFQHITL